MDPAREGVPLPEAREGPGEQNEFQQLLQEQAPMVQQQEQDAAQALQQANAAGTPTTPWTGVSAATAAPTHSQQQPQASGLANAAFGGYQQPVAQASAPAPYQPELHVSGANMYHLGHFPPPMQQQLPGLGGDGGAGLSNQRLVELGQQLSRLRSPAKQEPPPDAQQVCNGNVLMFIFTVSCNVCNRSWC
jgi:hypothetical protein